jgi:hypothetical protein
MSFQLIRKSDVPWATVRRGRLIARLTKQGQIQFNRPVTEAFGEFELAVIEYDEDAGTLKLTACVTPPKGLDPEDCFRLSKSVHKDRVAGSFISAKALLKWMGFTAIGAHKLEIAGINAERHSVTLILPQMSEAARSGAVASSAGACSPGERPRAVVA